MKAFKYFFVLITFLSAFFCSIHAQNFQIRWQKSIGGSGADNANCFIQRGDGTILLAGNSSSIDGDILLNKGGADIFVVKLDNLRNILWKKNLGGSNDDNIKSMVNTPEGGVIIAGSTNSNDIDVSGNHGGYDMWVVKLNVLGDIVWQKCYGGTSWEFANSIQATTDGGYIFTGETGSVDGDVTGSHGNYDFWITKIDSAGTLLWQKTLGGSLNDESTTIIQTEDQGFLVGGHSESFDGDVLSSHGSYDFWISKIDSIGTIEWQHTYGGSTEDYLRSLIQTPDHGFLLAGESNSNDGDVTGNHGNTDCWIVKVDSLGIIDWSNSFGGSASENASAVINSGDGSYYVAGASSSNDGDITIAHGVSDLWIYKISSVGNLLWQKTLGGSNQDLANAIQMTTDHDLILLGQSASNDGDITFNHGTSDYWLAQMSNPLRKITGHVFADFNANCILDPTDANLVHSLIHNVVENTHSIVEDSTFTIYTFDEDTAILEITNLDSSLYISCLTSDTIALYFDSGSSFDTSLINFPIRPIVSCYKPEIISLSNSFPRRCTRIIHELSYTNSGFDTARNAKIIVEVDTAILDSVSSSFSYTQIGDTLIFLVGDISPFSNSTIIFSTLVKCSTPLGVAACTRAYIYPISNCLSSPGYDTSDIAIKTNCSNDTVIVTLYNRLSHPMNESGSIIIFEDEIIQKIDSFKLLGGQSIVLKYLTSVNSTWTGELHQNHAHPTQPIIIRHDDRCALTLPVKTNIIIPHFPPHDESASYEENCSIILGSYDPNIKSVLPEGMYSAHLTDHDQVLKYRIDFQNTGSDTAFEVIVSDTLSNLLDINTLIPGNASHTYRTDILENHIVHFVFDPIVLPDSGHSEVNSHGYVTFKIQAKQSLPQPSIINNAANIYFDYNTSVRTNSVFNTIYDTVQIFIGIENLPLNQQATLVLYPNPASQKFFIKFDQNMEDMNINLFDAQGKKVIGVFKKSAEIIEIDASQLDKGIYLINCITKNGLLATKKIIIQ